MRTRFLVLAAMLGLFVGSQAQATIIDFANVGNSYLELKSDGATNATVTLDFITSTAIAGVGYDFTITGPAFGPDTLPPGIVGDLGKILNTFTYKENEIVTSGTTQTAALYSNSATLAINDGSGSDFTADILDSTIQSDGLAGTVNTTSVVVNLTNFAYTGSNPFYASLLPALQGVISVKFNLNGGVNLTSIANSSSPYVTSFAGRIEAVPEPSSIVLTALAALPLVGFTYLRRRRTTAPATV